MRERKDIPMSKLTKQTLLDWLRKQHIYPEYVQSIYVTGSQAFLGDESSNDLDLKIFLSRPRPDKASAGFFHEGMKVDCVYETKEGYAAKKNDEVNYFLHEGPFYKLVYGNEQEYKFNVLKEPELLKRELRSYGKFLFEVANPDDRRNYPRKKLWNFLCFHYVINGGYESVTQFVPEQIAEMKRAKSGGMGITEAMPLYQADKAKFLD